MHYYMYAVLCTTMHYNAVLHYTHIFILLLIIISFTRGTNCTKNIYLLYTLYKAPQLDGKNIQVHSKTVKICTTHIAKKNWNVVLLIKRMSTRNHLFVPTGLLHHTGYLQNLLPRKLCYCSQQDFYHRSRGFYY